MKYLITVIFLWNFTYLPGQIDSKSIHDYVESYVKTGDFSGCIQISNEDGIMYQECFGYANLAWEVPNQSSTKFMIGSISKQFTAVAILLLEQDGLLHTDDLLSSYFPDIEGTDVISIHHLLTHTSGIIDIYNIADFNQLSCTKTSLEELCNMILKSELNFEPGTQYQYSNGGYALLAHIIEQVSGVSYEEYLRTHIFDPLSMNNTGHPARNLIIGNLSTGYDPLGYSDLKTAAFIDSELLKGSGSLYSTVEDIRIWIKSINNSDLLSEQSTIKFLQDYGNNYGLGISVYSSFGNKVFGHDGRLNGYIGDYLYYQDAKITIVILGNIQSGVADFLRRDIAAIIFGEKYSSKAKSILPDTTDTPSEDLLGVYAFGPNFNVYVENFDGSIQARANEGGYSELVLLEDGRYFSRVLYAYIEFIVGDLGKITKMIWTNNDGNAFEGVKQ